MNSQGESGKEIQRLGDRDVFPSQASPTAFARPMVLKQGPKSDRDYFLKKEVKTQGE
jgi:hypothetical protein